MSGDFDLPVVERPAFFDGQRLTAADLEAVHAFHEAHRWLHNRALHNWGIVVGYEVAGARGDREVRVEPGFALDCRGRELILPERRVLAVPAVAASDSGGSAHYYLTVSYADDAALSPETREGVCGTRGAVRRPESPVARWRDADKPGRFERGVDIVLAAIEVRNCQLAAPVSTAERRDALPATQPYVAAGQTDPGKTTWRLWPATNPLGVATTVSTTSAGFQNVPRYQAHVIGERVLADGGVVDGYVQVAEPSAEGFELRMVLPAGVTGTAGRTHTVTRAQIGAVIDRLADRYKTTPPPPNDPVSVERKIILAANHLDPDHLGFSVGQKLRIPIELGNVTLFEYLFGLPGIAARYGTTVDVLKVADDLTTDFVLPDVPILVPKRTITYVIDFEDDLRPVLQGIANQYGTDVPTLMAANGFSPTTLFLERGQTLVVPPPATPLNPGDLLTDALALQLGEELEWHVVWMGVEG